VLIGLGAVVALVALPTVHAILLATTCALAYHAFTNAAARLLARGERLWPARTACLGLGLCVLVCLAMPAPALAGMLLAMLAGVLLGPLATASRRMRRYLRQRD
jgi:APA family basic amino acid/polyamine antiporter